MLDTESHEADLNAWFVKLVHLGISHLDLLVERKDI